MTASHAAVARGEHRSRLEAQIALLPTPTVGDSKSAANTTAGRADPDSKHHDGTTLTDWSRLLPTPAARDGDSRGTQRGAERLAQGHQLDLPEAVKELWSGGTLRPPSDDTNSSQDGQPRDQLTIEGV
jgi:hypothetical protein